MLGYPSFLVMQVCLLHNFLAYYYLMIFQVYGLLSLYFLDRKLVCFYFLNRKFLVNQKA